MTAFLHEVLTTPHGHALILYGNLIGLGFAVVAMVVGAVSFPLLLTAVASASSARWRHRYGRRRKIRAPWRCGA